MGKSIELLYSVPPRFTNQREKGAKKEEPEAELCDILMLQDKGKRAAAGKGIIQQASSKSKNGNTDESKRDTDTSADAYIL